MRQSENLELIASENEIAEIGRFVGADSIGYLTIEGMYEALGNRSEGFCDACFTGAYPVPVQLELTKLALEQSVPAAD